jgi:hypothetical protein
MSDWPKWRLVAVVTGWISMAGCPQGGRGTTAVGDGDVPQEQIAFFEAIRERCGDAYPGSTQFIANGDSPFADARLVMHIESCTDSIIRIPFVVGENHSRTWVLSLTPRGLLFKHDHRRADGTLEDTTNYGGWASREGTATTQHFPADDETAQMIPAASTNVWTVSIDTLASRFVYDLRRDDAPRFRAEFDMTTPVPPPPHP